MDGEDYGVIFVRVSGFWLECCVDGEGCSGIKQDVMRLL